MRRHRRGKARLLTGVAGEGDAVLAGVRGGKGAEGDDLRGGRRPRRQRNARARTRTHHPPRGLHPGPSLPPPPPFPLPSLIVTLNSMLALG